MKLLTGCLTLAAMLCCMPASQAEIVIDDFTVSALVDTDGVSPAPDTISNQAIAGGVSRTLSVAGSFATAQIDGVTNEFSATLGQNNSMSLSYDLSGTTERNFFVNQVLRTGFANVVGPNVFDIMMTVTSAGATDAIATWVGVGIETISQFNALNAVSAPGVGNGHLAAFANIDTIRFDITQTNPSFSVTTFGSASTIAAVPEPTSIALLGLTGLGGVVVARRRRKQTQAAA